MSQSSHISQLFEAFRAQSTLIVGDLMLDRYLWGNVIRISPEAPVPVVDVTHEEARPGGAANVAQNLSALGGKITLAGTVGQDLEGEQLLGIFSEKGFVTEGIQRLADRPTTRKTRVIGNRQQMLRIDREDRKPISADTADAILQYIQTSLDWVKAIILQDYEKGLLSPSLIQRIIESANEKGIITIVDPKYHNFLSYSGCTVFKPNLKELNEALKENISKKDIDGIVRGVMKLRERMPHQETVITLSENGVLAVDSKGNATHIPAHFRKITDVSGAGDTVVSVLCACKAAGLPLEKAAAIANLAGGLVCEEVGVVPIDPERLAAEMERLGI